MNLDMSRASLPLHPSNPVIQPTHRSLARGLKYLFLAYFVVGTATIMATPYRLPWRCYALGTALVLFFSVDATEGAIREYQFDVSMSACLCVCASATISMHTRLAPLPLASSIN